MCPDCPCRHRSRLSCAKGLQCRQLSIFIFTAHLQIEKTNAFLYTFRMELIKTIFSSQLDDTFFSTTRLNSTAETANVSSTVSQIISDVQKNGDNAVKNYASRFDQASPETFLISKEDLQNAKENLQKNNPDLYNSLCLSFNLAFEFAKKQKNCFTDFECELTPGLITGQKTIPVERAGIYVPAGRFPLLSSVIMCITPAKAVAVAKLCFVPRPVCIQKTQNFRMPTKELWRRRQFAVRIRFLRVAGLRQLLQWRMELKAFHAAMLLQVLGTSLLPRQNAWFMGSAELIWWQGQPKFL